MSDMSQNNSIEIDDTICPLCHGDNQCQAHQSKACWCFNANISQAIIDRVESQLKQKSCICQACIEKFNVELGNEVS